MDFPWVFAGRRFGRLFGVLLGLVLCVLPQLASAQTTIGRTGAGFVPGVGAYYGVPTAVATPGNSYTVAVAGTITSWSTQSNGGGFQSLIIFRPIGGGQYTVVAVSARQDLSIGGAGLKTFAVSIPVQVGDVLGMWSSGAASAITAGGGDVIQYAILGTEPAVNSTVTPNFTTGNVLLNISAQIGSAAAAAPVPALSPWMLALLALAMLGLGARRRL